MQESAEFEIYDGDEPYASAFGPRDEALREAINYALQCDEPIVYEVVRTRLEISLN